MSRRAAREAERRAGAGSGPATTPAPAGPPTTPPPATPPPTTPPTRPAGDREFYSGRDLSLFTPGWLARGLERRRSEWSRVDTYASWLTGVHLVVLMIIVGRGSLYLDDLRAQAYALHQPFLSFIVGSNGTHFAPVPRILDWVQSRAFPLEHNPATVVTLVVRLLLAIAFWRLLRRLFGPRPATLVPFTILLFTPVLLPATTWYRQSITVVACTVAIVWAFDAQLRWILDRRRLALVEIVLVTAVGVCCYEKAAAIPVILLGATFTLFGAGPARPGRSRLSTGLRRPVRAGLAGGGASALVVVAFLVIYRSGPYDQGASSSSRPSIADVIHLAWETSAHQVVPMLFGGPYHWSYPTPYAGTAQLGTTAVVFSLIVAALLLAVALRRGFERTLRAIGLLLCWVLPSVAIVAVGRFDQLELLLANAARLWADLVPGFLLSGALAVLPWRVGVLRSGPERPDDAVAAPSAPVADRGGPVEITVPVIATGLAMAIILGGSAVSSWSYASKWWDNPTGTWISNARASLAGAEPYPRVLATPLPEDVMPAWVSSQLPTSAPLLLLLRSDIRFHDGDGPAKVMNAGGERVAYLPAVVSSTKVSKLCLANIPVGGTRPVTVKLPTVAYYVPGAQVEVGVLLAETTKVEVNVVTPTGKVLSPERFSDDALPSGPHTLRFPVPLGQAVRSVQVRTAATQAGCLAYARIWAPLS
jgi:hypothetical protein